MRQHVTIHRAGEVVASFEAALEKTGESLTMVALLPGTGEAFALRQHGLDTTFDERIHDQLPFPPEYILLDINRVFLKGISASALSDGDHVSEDDSEEISETWHDGRLYSRRFRRLDGVPSGTVSISYHDGFSTTHIPSEIVLDNGWFGYRLDIRTLDSELL